MTKKKLAPVANGDDAGHAYYLRVSNKQIADTIPMYGIRCALALDKTIVYFELLDLGASLVKALAQLTESYSNIEKFENGYRVQISETVSTSIFEDGIAVIDLATDGTIVGIEVI